MKKKYLEYWLRSHMKTICTKNFLYRLLPPALEDKLLGWKRAKCGNWIALSGILMIHLSKEILNVIINDYL